MGNRAVITDKTKKIGVYLHYNGGRDSVEPMLAFCKLKGYRAPNNDRDYAYSRLCQIVGNFFGGTCSLGVGLYKELDTNNGNNGVYIIDDWDIVNREFAPTIEQDCYDFLEFLLELNYSQPQKEQLPIDEICNYAMQNKGYTRERVIAHLTHYVAETDISGAVDNIQQYLNSL